MEDILMLLGRLLLAGGIALLPGALVYGTVLGVYAAYRRLAAQISAEAG